MKIIKPSSFELYSFNPSNESHQVFLNEILNDKLTSAYLKDIDVFLLAKTNENPLENAYLVGKDNEIIGYLNLFDYANCVEMHYAVSPHFRGIRDNLNETLGCKFVKATSDFIFENYQRIEYIRLFIDKYNIESIKMALRAGFNQDFNSPFNDEYRKYRKK